MEIIWTKRIIRNAYVVGIYHVNDVFQEKLQDQNTKNQGTERRRKEEEEEKDSESKASLNLIPYWIWHILE